MLASSQSVLTCPLTKQPFQNPRFLLEDGFSYEKSAIEAWLKDNPNESPMIGKIPSATLLPNIALRRDFVCPITQEPFKEPYFCKEDSQTYEKDAIIKWFEARVTKNLELENYAAIYISSPMNGLPLDSFTLYTNKILFPNGNFPNLKEPLRFNPSSFISAASKLKTSFVFDTEIRELICEYLALDIFEFADKDETDLKAKINARRTAFGLKIQDPVWGGLDLSHLDLSNLTIKGLQQKCSLFRDTNFSGSTLIDCNFSNGLFVNCNLQKTTFINCDIRGEVVTFFNSDMKDAVIETKSVYLEKGCTWKRITNPDEFRADLKARGALNTDSIIFK